MNSFDLITFFVSTIGGGFVGFLAAVATSRERIRSLEKDIETLKATAERDRAEHMREMERVAKEVQDACSEERAHFKELERRQLAMLSLQIDIANKLGIQRRILPDAFTREDAT